MPDAFDLRGFGDYLAGPDVIGSYREHLRQLGEVNHSLAEPPRLIAKWREDPDNAGRGDWSPRQVDSWLRTKNYDGQDLEEFQVLAGAFLRERPA